MICPKCGFDQPDDAYCAFCGINIKKYRQERRKKQYAVYVLVSLAVIAGIFIAVNSFHQVKTPESITSYAEKKGEDPIKDTGLPGTKQKRLEAKRAPTTRKDIDHQRRSVSAFSRLERLEDKGPREIEPSRRRSLAEPTAGSVSETSRGERLTAKEWFEKGRALDDESESEVEFYEKALELNPEYAAAYYRLGAIHFRHARYELADQKFAKFIEHASEDDRQAYDIYVYYSPSDMERLSAAAVTEKASGEEEGVAEVPGEVSEEVEGEEKEVLSEAEEVGKEPEETEEGETETAVETEKEVPEETEEAPTEAPAEVSEEAEEEEEY